MYLLNDRARCHGKNCESRDTCERYLQRRTGGPQTPHYENMADGDVCGRYIEAAKSVPVEVFDSHCNYASFAGRVCNKCGRIHDGGKSVAEADELRKDAEKRDAREDRHWRAGFMDGWNAGVIGDESALKAAGERLDAAIAQGKGE